MQRRHLLPWAALAPAALKALAVVQAFHDGGITALPGTPERFAAFIGSEIDKYAQVVRAAHITLS